MQKNANMNSSTSRKLEPVPMVKVTSAEPAPVEKIKVQPNAGKVMVSKPKAVKKVHIQLKAVKAPKNQPQINKASIESKHHKKAKTPPQLNRSTVTPKKAAPSAVHYQVNNKPGNKTKSIPAKRASIHPTLMTKGKSKAISQKPAHNSVSKPTINYRAMLPDHGTANMERAVETNRARDIAAVGAAAGALRAVPGAPENSADLTRPGGVDLAGTGGSNPLEQAFGTSNSGPENLGALPEATTPQQQPANAGSGPGRAPLDPSYNSKDWMTGSASNWPWSSNEETVTLPTEPQAEPDKEITDKDAGVVPGGHMRLSDRTVTTNTVLRTDGGHTIMTTTRHTDGSGRSSVRYQHYGPSGEHDPATDDVTINSDDGDIAELQGTEGGPDDGAWARWAARFSGRRPDLSLKNPNKVNPGPGGATPEPQASRLYVPEEQLVGNPSPDEAGTQARAISTEQAAHLQDQLEEKVKGPGGHPGSSGGASPN